MIVREGGREGGRGEGGGREGGGRGGGGEGGEGLDMSNTVMNSYRTVVTYC